MAAIPAEHGPNAPAVAIHTSEPPRLRPVARVRELWGVREILGNLIRKEVKVKYTSSVLGALWSLLNPVLYLAVFSLVFAIVLPNKIPNFPVYLLSGILAWNFFTPFAPGDAVGGADYYRPAHIGEILAQLHSDHVDLLVVLPLDDAAENARQVELVRSWQVEGRVRSLGLWVADVSALPPPGADNPFQFAIHPCNVATPEAPALFAACKARGMTTLATSPFHRGWTLDRLIEAAVTRGEGEREELRPILADLMLRYALHTPGVDRVIVAMRKAAWVARNLESVARGPLAPEELRRLQDLKAFAERRPSLWRRLLRRL